WTGAICTRPFAVDWDGDGDLDLVVGNFDGTFYLFRGEGKGEFKPEAEAMKAGKSPLRIEGHHSDPFVTDWDGDGDLDLLSGSSNGGVQWAENIAGAGEPPELRPFRTLIKPGRNAEYGEPLNEDELTGPTTSTRIWVADVNGDGKLDLLVGDSVTLISPAKGLSDAEFKKKYAAWEKTYQAALKSLRSDRGEKLDQKASEEFDKVYRQRSDFMREEMTGFVRLYLQK